MSKYQLSVESSEGYVKAHCIILFFCIELKISNQKLIGVQIKFQDS